MCVEVLQTLLLTNFVTKSLEPEKLW